VELFKPLTVPPTLKDFESYSVSLPPHPTKTRPLMRAGANQREAFMIKCFISILLFRIKT